MPNMEIIHTETPAGPSTHILINADCADMMTYINPQAIDLHLFSNPYPGVGKEPLYETHAEYVDWLSRRAWVITTSLKPSGTLLQNIWYPKRLDHPAYQNRVIFDRGLLEWPDIWNGWAPEMELHNIYVWDKLNPPPTGWLKRRPIDRTEFVYAMVRPGFTYNHYRRPYASKTKGKAKTGNMRKDDVRGNMTGNNAKLHKNGAIPYNLIQASNSGGSEGTRERAYQGSYPVALAMHLIFSYANKGETVCDITAGACTTAVAAALLGINSVCFDTSAEELRKGARALMDINDESKKMGLGPLFFDNPDDTTG